MYERITRNKSVNAVDIPIVLIASREKRKVYQARVNVNRICRFGDGYTHRYCHTLGRSIRLVKLIHSVERFSGTKPVESREGSFTRKIQRVALHDANNRV